MSSAAAPRESRTGSHSGRLLLRMPEALHAELARASQKSGKSLNAFINEALDSAVSRRRRPPAGPPVRRYDRLLLANLIVVGVVGVLCIVLLVQTLR
ncbi:MAG TPA: toxin-antitoxin system HicB family antitoxin [Gaiellaceae bacterium]|nr:toxin-antitoxin system HicB family antitoxin [Gaiellaceae bacterium]